LKAEKQATVAIVKGADPRASAKQVVELLGGMKKFVKPNDFVLIKPNIVSPAPPGRPPEDVVTDPQLVAALVEQCLEAGARKVMVGDNPGLGFSSRVIYEETSYEEPIREAGGEMSYFTEEPLVKLKVPGGHLTREARVPKIFTEADVFLNIPKMKTNSMSGGVTLGMKNLVGVPPFEDRPEWHRWPEIHYHLVDLLKLCKPALTIIDGIIAMEGRGPMAGPAIRMDVVIGGPDTVAVDAVGAEIMGFEPMEIPSIQVAEREDMGVADLNRIDVVGTPISEVQKRFMRPIGPVIHPSPNVKVYPGGACYGCQVWISMVPNPFEVKPDKKYVLITGQRPRVPDQLEADEIWVLGKCADPYAKKWEKRGHEVHSVPYCPPHAWITDNILRPTIAGRDKMEMLYTKE